MIERSFEKRLETATELLAREVILRTGIQDTEIMRLLLESELYALMEDESLAIWSMNPLHLADAFDYERKNGNLRDFPFYS
ncbi:MAG: hypothetical protein LBN34_07675 [Clostridiales Family XIII bacterium]|jgi:predicted xylose isomerase-like sugar epimerase|nr:hypothetical protein [Clostridiales Family XIII bacterium]